MRKSLELLFLCLLICYGNIFGQITNTGFVFGKVTEQTTSLPLQFVNVFLMHPGDSNFVLETTTVASGTFQFDSLIEGEYYVTVSLIGFETFTTSPFTVTANERNVDVGSISLKPSEILLKEVKITAEQSTYVNAIDRKIYHPENDIQAQSGSVSDILQNIPSVSVDEDGAVSLRGGSNVTIFINGKPSMLMNNNSAAILQQIPASSIERIEIITNASAKYKPDGTSGIINIVLKKSTKLGFNGIVMGNVGTNNRYNGSITLNYNTGKINVYGSYGFRRNYYPRTLTDIRTINDTVTGAQTFFNLNNSSLSTSFSHTANFGLDYFINDRNKIGFASSVFTYDMNRTEMSKLF